MDLESRIEKIKVICLDIYEQNGRKYFNRDQLGKSGIFLCDKFKNNSTLELIQLDNGSYHYDYDFFVEKFYDDISIENDEKGEFVLFFLNE